MTCQTALAAVLDRYPDLALAVDEHELSWSSGLRHRGLTALPVIL